MMPRSGQKSWILGVCNSSCVHKRQDITSNLWDAQKLFINAGDRNMRGNWGYQLRCHGGNSGLSGLREWEGTGRGEANELGKGSPAEHFGWATLFPAKYCVMGGEGLWIPLFFPEFRSFTSTLHSLFMIGGCAACLIMQCPLAFPSVTEPDMACREEYGKVCAPELQAVYVWHSLSREISLV